MLLLLVSLWLTLASGVVVVCWWMPLKPHRKPITILLCGYSHASIGFLAVVSATLLAVVPNHTVRVLTLTSFSVALAAGISTVILTRRWELHEAAPPEATVPSSAVVIHGLLAATAIAAGLRFLFISF